MPCSDALCVRASSSSLRPISGNAMAGGGGKKINRLSSQRRASSERGINTGIQRGEQTMEPRTLKGVTTSGINGRSSEKWYRDWVLSEVWIRDDQSPVTAGSKNSRADGKSNRIKNTSFVLRIHHPAEGGPPFPPHLLEKRAS